MEAVSVRSGKALFLAQTKVDPLAADLSSVWNWWHWVDGVRHFALGFTQSATQSKGNCQDVHPLTGNPLGGDGCSLRRTAYLVKTGWTTPNPTDHPDVVAQVKVYMPMVSRVYNSFQKMRKGGNPKFPLARLQSGMREFDYNVDGLANYGMIPDFLQDAANQLRVRPSSTVKDLRVLFRSAEDYIQMWQKTWSKKVL
jgi:hypothetical protein